MRSRKSCSYCLQTWAPGHDCPEANEIADTMRDVRACMRHALNGRTVQLASGIAGCSANTVHRILRGENVMIATVARIVARLGSKIHVEIQP